MIESGIFTALLDALPMDFDKDAHAEKAVSVVYDGSALASIASRQFSTVVTGGSGSSIAVDLKGKTLTDFVAAVNANTGYSATLIADGSLPAVSLMPVQGQSLTAPLSRFTALLWKLFLPIAWAFERAYDNLTVGTQQMSTHTAEGAWLDYWSDLYGGITRLTGEADRAYGSRIMREVTRWRLNEYGIAEAIEDGLGVEASVENLHNRAWIWDKPMRKYAGRKFSRTTFQVSPMLEVSQAFLRAIVDANRQAGIMPYYLNRIIAGWQSQLRFGGKAIKTIKGSLETLGKFGAVSLSAHPAFDVVFGAGGALVLGTAALGSGVLGGSGAIAISDSGSGVAES